MGSNLDSLDGLPPVSDFLDLMPVPNSYTDVNVVPEHEKNELGQSILNLEGEMLQLKLKKKLVDEKRRDILNKILNIKGSIRVFCRVRPSLLTDKRRGREIVSTGLETVVVNSAGSRKEFRFDKVFPQEAIQEDVFVEVLPILKSALDGNNVCLLAYGQTGTGKTFTMDGTPDQPGIVPRALEVLLHQASLDNSSVTFSMSMLEIYMGNLRDLLAPKPVCRAYDAVTRCNLNIQTDPKGLMEIEGLTEVQIPNFAKARWWYSKGIRVRSTSLTNVNEASSRSHCLTRITIFRHGNVPGTKVEVSKLWMVDLGGSERLLKTGATGQTLDEGRAINLSLSALADVIAALRRKKGHVPYRNSKLTQILKDSLGDGSKVLMVLHVSPAEVDIGETICSLRFANRARGVESNKELPEHLKKQLGNRIENLQEDLRKAEEECRTVRNQIKKVEFLLSENKKLFSTTYQPLEDEKVLGSPKGDFKEANRAPLSLERPIKRNISNSMPRFMTSTAASRQRQETAEREIVGRASSLRPETRSSILFSGSQSLSYSDTRFKAVLRSSDKKSRYAEPNPIPTESPRCSALDLKTVSLPRTNIVALSDPKFRAKLHLHRRRMSNLI